MKPILRVLCLGMVMCCLWACATGSVRPPKWKYKEKAIKLRIWADEKLNFEDGSPHTLLLCVYQLRDPTAFTRLSKDTDGLYKLLECKLFDSSVTTVERLIINPGEARGVTFDRAEGTRYVALVAGYYTLEKDRIIRMADIPVVTRTTGFIRRQYSQHPDTLYMELLLGEKQIKTFKRN